MKKGGEDEDFMYCTLQDTEYGRQNTDHRKQNTETHVHKTTYGQVGGGWALEISTFWDL